jgi:acetylornithine deacetylase/succinyl-diaminopimelate desuccinylase-like protein
MTDWQARTPTPSIRILPPKRPFGASIATPSLNVGRDRRRQQHQRRSRQGYGQARPVEVRLAQVMRQAVEGKPGIRREIGRRLLAAGPAAAPGTARLATDVQGHASAVFAEPLGRSPGRLYADARHDGEVGLPVVRYGARCCRQC